MSFEPIDLPKVVQQVPDCTVATRVHSRRDRQRETRQVVFRFAGPFARKVGMGPGVKFRAFWDRDGSVLRFATCQYSEPSGRMSLRGSGSVFELRFPWPGPFERIVPKEQRRVPIPVLGYAQGSITLNLIAVSPRSTK